MNKTKLLIGSIIMLALSVVIWSCKDTFTEEDQLKLQAQLDADAKAQNDKSAKDSIALSIQVYNASVTAGTLGGRTSSTKGLASIDVKLTYNGKTETKASDDSGIATFYVRPGSVSGTLSKTGYTTVNFTLSVTKPANDVNNHLTNASVMLPVFATTGATVSKVAGNVSYEGDLLNNTRESVPDGKVKITFSPTQASLESYYSTSVNSTNADVDKYSIEGNFIATVTGGKFSIDLPTGAGDTGLSYNYIFSDFEADQKIAINQFENDVNSTIKRDVTTIPTQFTTNLLPNNAFTSIPAVSAVRIDIASPPPVGTGAALTLKLQAGPVTSAGFVAVALGSGYTPSVNNIPVTVVGGDFDSTVPGATPAVLFASTNAAGQIIDIQTTGGSGGTLGFGYRSQATLSFGGGGSGAIYRVNYSSPVAPQFGTGVFSGSSLISGGSGYAVPPSIVVRALTSSGTSIETIGDTQVVNGSVVTFAVGGSFSKITSVVIKPVARVDAIASTNILVNGSGEILPNGAGIVNSGSGYDPSNPPAVSIKDLRVASPTPANWGARMTGGGAIQYLFAINQGSGYSNLGNANFPSATISFSVFGITSGTALRPGVTYTLNSYYGTGIKTQAVQ